MQIVISLLLFFIALGVLITIHEFGHFFAAKSFNVYCSDFSIGFGPKICNIKRKKGETTFKIGIIPVGGYVSMYGEGVDLPNGVNIPKSRSLEGINRWKRLIIMASGIIMNFVLAYIIFFLCNACFIQYSTPYLNVINVSNQEAYRSSEKLLDEDGETVYELERGDVIQVSSFKFSNGETEQTFGNIYTDLAIDENNKVILRNNNYAYDEENDKYYLLMANVSNAGVYQYDEYSNFLTLVEAVPYDINYVTYIEGNKEYPISLLNNDVNQIYLPRIENNAYVTHQIENGDNYTFNVAISHNYGNEGDSKPNYESKKLIISDLDNNQVIDNLNFGLDYTTYWNGRSSFAKAGEDFIESTTLISQAIGGLFIGQGWENMGGPVAIFTQTTSILTNNPFNYYLQSWGIISVNLALFNLLPFPGLDGWQILVTIIEGITNFIKKRIYLANLKTKGKKIPLEKINLMKKLNEDIIDVKKKYKDKFEIDIDKDSFLNDFPPIGSEAYSELEPNPKFDVYKEYLYKIDVYNDYVNKENLNDITCFKEWAIPEKIKNVVSLIGLILLFGLIGVVFIMDIVRLF